MRPSSSAPFLRNCGKFALKTYCTQIFYESYIIRQAGFRIRHFVADAPVLCKIKKMAGHSGFWGCTVCDAKGESCRLDKADCPDKRTKTDGGARVYRSSTMSTATVWTHESIKNVAEDVESGKANTPEECKGIAGKSLLLDFPGNVLLPPEAMRS